MIKLIIFDLSGVCFTNEEPIYIDFLCKKYGYDYKEFNAFYQSMLVKAEVGKMTCEELWAILIEKYDIPKTVSQIVDEMMELKEPKLDALDLASQLKKKLEIVYLTNYNKLYWNAIKDKFDMNKWFSSGFVSYQLGVRKPSSECFNIILNEYNLKPSEVIFIDDFQSNLDEAKKLGIFTILFKDKDNLAKDIDDLIKRNS
jgi:putative hydrolase of the HAD superfamily